MIFTQPGADFDAFVVQASPSLLRLAFRLTGDRHAAEDLLQNALLRVARRWRHASDQPWAYTRTVLVRLSADSWRRAQRRVRETYRPATSGTLACSDTDQRLVEHRSYPAGEIVDVHVSDRLLEVWSGDELIKTAVRTSEGQARKKRASKAARPQQ